MNKLESRALATAKAQAYARTGHGRHVRVTAGLSQAQLGAAIGRCAATVNRWERGKARPSGAAAIKGVELVDALAKQVSQVSSPR